MTTFRTRTRFALAETEVRANVAKGVDRFVAKRRKGMAGLEDVDSLREVARAMKAEILADLPALLEQLADQVLERGGHVCWAATADDATRYIRALAESHAEGGIVKAKSMATEEIGLNRALQADEQHVVETDLGEWIIQLAHETPSHIIAPALHRNRYSIADVFRDEADAGPIEPEPEALNAFARGRLRKEFLNAGIGVSGVNLAVAESGSIVLVTNEGNGRMVTSMPRVHVAVMGMERIVATWDQADLLVNLLARSATGQPLSSYTSVITGPSGGGEVDGPGQFHLVILDNGRSELLGGEFHEMLACIRCGACLNVCPVYRQVGGHAYGWVYSGPMGAVLSPLLAAGPGFDDLSGASTLCGACMDVCPVQIPLQDLLLGLRRRKADDAGVAERTGWRTWSRLWSSPSGYRASTRLAAWGDGLGRHAPGIRRWGVGRTPPTPARRRFRDRWEELA